MLKKAKIFFLLSGIILGIISVYLFVLMDFTFIKTDTGLEDGLGFTILKGIETEGFSRFIYNLTSIIPFFREGTHAITLWYFVVRALDVLLLVTGFGFIVYGVLGPESDTEIEAMMQGMDEGELE